jgi:hypothetical protein
MDKSILIIGNGPSVKNVNFDRVKMDTFGMNNAYKFYEGMNWYPTYWGCFDLFNTQQNTAEHLEFFKLEKPTHCYSLIKESSGIENTTFVKIASYNFGHGVQTSFSEWNDVGNTSSNCVQIAINKGYKTIYLIGIDGGQTIGNVVHGWDGYYKEGETLNPPNETKYHAPIWKNLKDFSKQNEINVYNCNPNSYLLKGLFDIRGINDVYGD